MCQPEAAREEETQPSGKEGAQEAKERKAARGRAQAEASGDPGRVQGVRRKVPLFARRQGWGSLRVGLCARARGRGGGQAAPCRGEGSGSPLETRSALE